jgi:DNA repair protein RadC
MSIHDWPVSERPREKLLIKGPHSLSDAELLAIFLRTGCKGKTAIDLARDLLIEFGGLRQILESTREAFCKTQGLGDAKYTQLQAVMEMARRHLSEYLTKEDNLNSPDQVREYLIRQLRHQSREIFAALFLDSQHRLLMYDQMFYGTIDSASVHPREVVKKALDYNAAALIFAHNHPSGVAEPSAADKHITTVLQKALRLVDIEVLDHFVIGDGEIISFAQRGWLC